MKLVKAITIGVLAALVLKLFEFYTWLTWGFTFDFSWILTMMINIIIAAGFAGLLWYISKKNYGFGFAGLNVWLYFVTKDLINVLFGSANPVIILYAMFEATLIGIFIGIGVWTIINKYWRD